MTLSHSELFGAYPKPVGPTDPLLERALGTFMDKLDEVSKLPPAEAPNEGRYRTAMREVLIELGLVWNSVSVGLPPIDTDNLEVIFQDFSANPQEPLQSHWVGVRFTRDGHKPLWLDGTGAPIEGDSWRITHWRKQAILPPLANKPL